MTMNKIIAVWGNPNSGKTTLSLKLALELEKMGKSVMIIMADAYTPGISAILPFIDTKDKSLGEVLSSVEVTQESILKKCISLEKHKNIVFMSYLHGENLRTYADYGKDRTLDLFILLRHLADHIIVDCSSCFPHDLLTRTALELSDKVVRLTTPDLKAVSFLDALMPLLDERKFGAEHHLKVLSNVKPQYPKDIVANRYGGIGMALPYTSEVEKQHLEARLLEDLTDKNSQFYNRAVKNLIKEILGEEPKNTEKEDKLNKSKLRKISFFRKEVKE